MVGNLSRKKWEANFSAITDAYGVTSTSNLTVLPLHLFAAIRASSKIATARVQPAEAPRILWGKQLM